MTKSCSAKEGLQILEDLNTSTINSITHGGPKRIPLPSPFVSSVVPVSAGTAFIFSTFATIALNDKGYYFFDAIGSRSGTPTTVSIIKTYDPATGNMTLLPFSGPLSYRLMLDITSATFTVEIDLLSNMPGFLTYMIDMGLLEPVPGVCGKFYKLLIAGILAQPIGRSG